MTRSILVKRVLQSGHLFSRSDHFSMHPKQNWWSQPLIIARSFGSTSHIQIQQFTALAASFFSTVSLLPSDLPSATAVAAAGGAFFNPALGGGFFRILVLLRAFFRLPVAVEAFRFLDAEGLWFRRPGGSGTEAADAVAGVLVMSIVLVYERLRDRVVGPVVIVSSLRDLIELGKEVLDLTADAGVVTDVTLRVRG